MRNAYSKFTLFFAIAALAVVTAGTSCKTGTEPGSPDTLLPIVQVPENEQGMLALPGSDPRFSCKIPQTRPGRGQACPAGQACDTWYICTGPADEDFRFSYGGVDKMGGEWKLSSGTVLFGGSRNYPKGTNTLGDVIGGIAGQPGCIGPMQFEIFPDVKGGGRLSDVIAILQFRLNWSVAGATCQFQTD